MMKSEGRREAVKIVQIETRYVRTDALNFKDVVQSLTGKNSSTAWVGNGSLTDSAVEVKPQEEGITITIPTHHHDHDHDHDYKQDASLSSMILKNMSSKDVERLFSELPPMEDIAWFVAPSNFAT